MRLTSDEIAEILADLKDFFTAPLRLQFTAGWGCTVLEVFERDERGPQVPLRRILL